MQSSLKNILKISAVSFVSVVVFFMLVPEIKIANFNEEHTQSFATIVETPNDMGNDIGVEHINDYAPIFIPTKWNCSPQLILQPRPQDKMTYNVQTYSMEDEFKLALLSEKHKNIDSLKHQLYMQRAFSGFGINCDDFHVPQIESTLVIKDLSTGKITLQKNIPEVSEKHVASISEFTLRIDNNTAQTPILTKSSGNDNVDKKLLELVRKESLSLPKGDYNATIIP